MANLAQLSDDELNKMIEQKSAPKSLSSMSDEDLDKLIAAKQGQPQLASDSFNAAKVGVEKGLTFGARPLIAGLAGGAGYAIDQLRQGKSGIEGFKTGFSEARREAKDEQARLAETDPGASLLGEIGGSLLVPGAALKAITRGAKGIDAAGRLGLAMGTGRALGEADSASEGIGMAATGGALGLAGEGGVKLASKATNAIARKLDAASAANALKSAGAMLKDYRALEGKGQAQKFGRELMGRGLVKAGDTVDSVAKKAETLRQDAGKALDSIYSYARNSFGSEAIPGFNPFSQKEDILRAAQEKLGDSVDGKAAIKKLSDYLDDLVIKYGDQGLDPRKANDIKGALDEVINYSRNPLNKQPDVEKAFHAAREFVSRKIDDGIEAIGVKTGRADLIADLKEANRAYSTGKQASGMAADKTRRENANKALGLRQSILVGGGAGAGAMYGLASGGDPGDVLIGAGKGALAGASLKTIEKYGPAIAAHAEKVLADQIQKSAVLRRMVEKSPQAYQNLLAKVAEMFTGPGGVPAGVPQQMLSGETP